MYNSICYIHGMGEPMITTVIIGVSLLAIFGRMPWPALFSLGVFVAVFFGGPQITKAITEKEVCCLKRGQTLDSGKCVAATEHELVGKQCGISPDKHNKGQYVCCPTGSIITNQGGCTKNPSRVWQ